MCRGGHSPTRDALAAFFEEHGVSAGEFGDVYDSFAVESLVRKSVAMQRNYGVRATPNRDRQRQVPDLRQRCGKPRQRHQGDPGARGERARFVGLRELPRRLSTGAAAWSPRSESAGLR